MDSFSSRLCNHSAILRLLRQKTQINSGKFFSFHPIHTKHPRRRGWEGGKPCRRQWDSLGLVWVEGLTGHWKCSWTNRGTSSWCCITWFDFPRLFVFSPARCSMTGRRNPYCTNADFLLKGLLVCLLFYFICNLNIWFCSCCYAKSEMHDGKWMRV